ncbi:alkaline-phosphatase-like protein [Dactylonectria macrodidyma]|uniref:Alkaline-phosphatase-like protein n=1 Tax=Dactylonectria macrodidyma TaxID=307937 RepID=A0A9P9JBN7_9HYPO|nr:alkaline-phosphatase-like protein [Dactylonectria macrodidyma]
MSQKRPNFLIIIADDLGFSDTGPYGSEINTPALNRLAREGLRMTNFHTAPACSPTRSMLFSGTDSHIAGLGCMWEHMQFHKDHFKGQPGYEGYLNYRVAALPELLSDAGYFTVLSGKWHLGLTKEFAPCSRGFKKNFSFLPGSGNHSGYEPQLDQDEIFFPALCTDGHWMEGDKFLDHRKDLPEDFFSTVSFTDKLLGFLEGRTTEEKEQPFFACLPFTAPHWPLQASKERIARHAGKYDDGPDVLTQKRVQRLIELGLAPEGATVPPPFGRVMTPSWDALSPEERKRSARTMEVYAAMVEQIDENIGRVIDYLESVNELDNTFVLFMSDNGAEGAALEALPLMGGPRTIASIIEKYYDNSTENLGNKDSFIWYGPRWASAGTAPSRGLKCSTLEGGIRCPCIIRYPPLQPEPGSISNSFLTVMDILPTVLEMAKTQHPGATYKDREVALPRGKSWVPHLASSKADVSVHEEETHVHGWELFGHRAIRQGNWKAVWNLEAVENDGWELYDLANDPAEMNDLAGKNTEVLDKLVLFWDQYVSETGMIPTPMWAKKGKS